MSDTTSQIAEHMEVVGNDGQHFGTVDMVGGNRIKLTKRDDPDGSGHCHHYLPLGAVGSVQGGKATPNMAANAARGEATARDPGA